eukprot:scaffold234818_cov30-Tisochrysis_lutea.AAC.1
MNGWTWMHWRGRRDRVHEQVWQEGDGIGLKALVSWGPVGGWPHTISWPRRTWRSGSEADSQPSEQGLMSE